MRTPAAEVAVARPAATAAQPVKAKAAAAIRLSADGGVFCC